MARDYFGEHSLRSLIAILKPELEAKVEAKDIVDTLTSYDESKPLSANQGRVLKDLIDNIDITDTIQSMKGKVNGLAPLNSSGKVDAEYLPSYVDDVVDGYLNKEDNLFYEDEEYTEEITGESGKIYIDLNTNVSYRWSGTVFVAIDADGLVEMDATTIRSIWDEVSEELPLEEDGSE